MPAKILPFVSRSEQLRLRSWRDYSRYMLVVKGFVAADSLERAQWQKEYAKDARRDAEWKLRHGPVGGVAKVLVWRTKANKPRNLTGKHTTNQGAKVDARLACEDFYDGSTTERYQPRTAAAVRA